ncbi:MAG TPA: penicillin-binding protein 2 [Natronosporangium sp.]|nr:penicillin-binding protein 2 [Natronosporangium sp.]
MADRRSALARARAYHPRGRTVPELPRPARDADPDPPGRGDGTPAGGRTGARSRTAGRSGTGGARAGTARTGASRTGAADPTARGAARRRSARQPASGSRTAAPPGRRGPRRPRKPPPLASPRRRLRLATLLVLAMFAALGIRLIELQITEGSAYAASGLATRLQTVTLPAARGAIYDRNGDVLAHSVEARLVYADPELVSDPREVAETLQPYLDVPAAELLERMRPRLLDDGEPSRYQWLARGVDIAVADQIMALKLPGIGVHYDERRHVPGNDLAANLIGFTSDDLTGPAGLEGLEAQFDEVLRGVDGQRTYERGEGITAELEIAGGYRIETPPQPGSDLRLTVDMDVQYEVQRILTERLAGTGAPFGAAVLLDARTGEVLAMASYPGFDAADPYSAPAEHRRNVATSVVFDPGSAHKPIVFGAALEEGVISPGESLVINPTINKGDQTFSDVVWHPPGTRLSQAAMLAYSSNVGTIMVADRLGSDRLYAYQRAFGLGEVTGVGMPGEAAGALLAPEDWYGSSYGSVPIGHSVDVTVLQLAAAYGAIANDGVWVQPRLVQAVIAPDGEEQPLAEPATRRVLSPDTAAYLRQLLEAVVTVPNATGRGAAVENYRVAGKTGTGALVVDGEYADGAVSSFIGMAPADQPRYVLAVSAYQADTDTVTGAFRDMMSFALQHYRVPPAETGPPVFELYP